MIVEISVINKPEIIAEWDQTGDVSNITHFNMYFTDVAAFGEHYAMSFNYDFMVKIESWDMVNNHCYTDTLDNIPLTNSLYAVHLAAIDSNHNLKSELSNTVWLHVDIIHIEQPIRFIIRMTF